VGKLWEEGLAESCVDVFTLTGASWPGCVGCFQAG